MIGAATGDRRKMMSKENVFFSGKEIYVIPVFVSRSLDLFIQTKYTFTQPGGIKTKTQKED
jgi:hypothetical protein